MDFLHSLRQLDVLFFLILLLYFKKCTKTTSRSRVEPAPGDLAAPVLASSNKNFNQLSSDHLYSTEFLNPSLVWIRLGFTVTLQKEWLAAMESLFQASLQVHKSLFPSWEKFTRGAQFIVWLVSLSLIFKIFASWY